MGRWSRYWAGRSFDSLFDDEDENKFVVPSMRQSKKKSDYDENSLKLLRLLNIRRGIANFVSIVGGRNVPVKFSSGDQSYTDGESVVVSASTNPDEFDSMVGLAIHEASHIRMSAPVLMFNRLVADNTDWVTRRPFDKFFTPIMNLAQAKYGPNHSVNEVFKMVWDNFHTILNILEDRRIDSWLYQTAPGYRPYYEDYYERLFYSDYVKLAVHHPEFRKPTWDSYRCHMLNIHTEWADRTALPGLDKIYDIVNIKNIDRYTTREEYAKFVEFNDQFNLNRNNAPPMILEDARKILLIILEHCPVLTSPPESNDEKGNEESPPARRIAKQLMKMLNDAQANKDPNLDPGGQGIQIDINEILKNIPKDEADALKQAMEKALARVGGAVKGNIHKKQLEGDSEQILKTLESSNAVLREGEVSTVDKCHVIFYRKVTPSNIDGMPFYAKYGQFQENVTNGVAMGRVLAYRLRIMNDESLTTFPYQRFGRVDKKRLHAIPSGDERVFTRTHIEKIKPVLIDLTLDGSGSMGGEKWNRTMALAVALAVASSKIRSLDIRITLRATSSSPWIAILYDSRSQNIRDFLTMVPFISYSGGTPEGLTFDAIREELVEKVKNTRRFFVNISDGEPAYSFTNVNGQHVNYWGHAAGEHTRHRIKELREMGVTILSYYVEDGHSPNTEVFKRMYGKDARFIDVTSITDIARTLNEMFLNSDARE